MMTPIYVNHHVNLFIYLSIHLLYLCPLSLSISVTLSGLRVEPQMVLVERAAEGCEPVLNGTQCVHDKLNQ